MAMAEARGRGRVTGTGNDKLTAMATFPPLPPGPPSCANCVTTVQPAAGGAPVQTPSSMVRSSDGKMRIDTPNTTVITNPATGQAIVLNHLTKQAQVVPLQPPAPQIPQLQNPQAGTPPPGTPPMPAVAVQDLGKSLIDGHPVDGKRYTVQPPAPPQAPQVPPAPTVSEVWTSTQLKMPRS